MQKICVWCRGGKFTPWFCSTRSAGLCHLAEQSNPGAGASAGGRCALQAPTGRRSSATARGTPGAEKEDPRIQTSLGILDAI